VAGRRDDLDSVDVDVTAAERNVDVRVLANLEQLGGGGVQ